MHSFIGLSYIICIITRPWLVFLKHPRKFYGEFVFVAVAIFFWYEAGLGAMIMPDEKLTEFVVVTGKSLPAAACVAKATHRPNQPYSRQVALVRDALVLSRHPPNHPCVRQVAVVRGDLILSRQPPNHPCLWQVTMGVEIVSVSRMQSPNHP